MGAESDFTSAIKPIEKAAGVVLIPRSSLIDCEWVPALPSSAKCAARRPGHEVFTTMAQSSQPRRGLVHRDQRIDLDAGAHHRVLIGLDQNFRHQRAGVVA
jgi:hypothetical protein